MPKPYPPTPELDKMKAVQSHSQAIGEFLDIYCNEKGYELCQFRKAGDNGMPYRIWKTGVKNAILDGASTEDRKPRAGDVLNGDAILNPEYCEWPDGYIPLRKPLQKLLAEAFEIDLEKVDQERRAILESLH